MNVKQGFVTGVLAMVIVFSVTFMPVNAGTKESQSTMARPSQSGMIAQGPATSTELPQDQVRDLTYN